jgi:hypothetical protein
LQIATAALLIVKCFEMDGWSTVDDRVSSVASNANSRRLTKCHAASKTLCSCCACLAGSAEEQIKLISQTMFTLKFVGPLRRPDQVPQQLL